MDSIRQKIRVVESDKEGYAYVYQSIPVLSVEEYRYEVRVEDVGVLIQELDRRFKDMMGGILKDMGVSVDEVELEDR